MVGWKNARFAALNGLYSVKVMKKTYRFFCQYFKYITLHLQLTTIYVALRKLNSEKNIDIQLL